MKLILTGINNKPLYQDHLKVFLMSMRMNSLGEKVIVRLTDCSDEYAEDIKKIYLVKVQRAKSNGHKFEQLYARFYMFRDAMKDFSNISVAWIDPDTIIRNELDFWGGTTGSTIKVWYRPGKEDKYKYQTGVFILGNVATTQSYVKTILKEVANKGDWLYTQHMTYEFARKFYLSHIPLDEKYNDSRFKKDSVIWHCKTSHFKDARYQKEYQYYLKKANILCRKK